MRTAIVRFAAVFALVAGALVFGTAASADPGDNGAVVTRTPLDGHGCFPAGVFQNCSDVTGSVNTVQTPSGDQIVVAHEQYCVTVTDTTTGTVAYHQCEQVMDHSLTMDGVLQQMSSHNASFMTAVAGDTQQTICTKSHFVYANGQVRVDQESSC